MFIYVCAHNYACVRVSHTYIDTHSQSAYSNTQPMGTRRTGQTSVDKGGQQETRMSRMCLTAVAGLTNTQNHQHTHNTKHTLFILLQVRIPDTQMHTANKIIDFR